MISCMIVKLTADYACMGLVRHRKVLTHEGTEVSDAQKVQACFWVSGPGSRTGTYNVDISNLANRSY